MGIDNIDQPVEYSEAQVDQGPAAAAADLLAQTQSRLNLLANLMRNTSLDLGALLQQIIGDLGQALPQADIRIIYLYDEHYQAASTHRLCWLRYRLFWPNTSKTWRIHLRSGLPKRPALPNPDPRRSRRSGRHFTAF
jgi:hypothetical protein